MKNTASHRNINFHLLHRRSSWSSRHQTMIFLTFPQVRSQVKIDMFPPLLSADKSAHWTVCFPWDWLNQGSPLQDCVVSKCISVMVLCGFHNKLPQTICLQTNIIYSLTIWKTESRCLQGHTLSPKALTLILSCAFQFLLLVASLGFGSWT